MDTMDQLPRQNSAIQLPSVDDEESDDFTIIQSVQVFKGIKILVISSQLIRLFPRCIHCG